MYSRKQIVIIGLVVVLVGLLFSLDIKGLVKEEGQHSGEAATEAATISSVDVETVSATAKQELSAAMSRQVTELETKLKSAAEAEKPALIKALAKLWQDVNKPAPAALYTEQLAQQSKGYADWMKAGDLFASAFQTERDSLLQPAFNERSGSAYKKALELDPSSLDAKTGMGVAYVNGGTQPMEGINILLDVVKQDPANQKANMSLGLFAIKSGQFDKGVGRFKTVLQQQPSPDAWFYLATCYENLGEKANAIDAYTKSKELAADPGFTQYIDQRIEALKK